MVGLTAEDSWSGTPTSMPHQHNNAHGDLALDRLGCIDYRFCGISLWWIVCHSWKDKKDNEDWEPASGTLLVNKKWCNGIQNTDINSTKSNQVWSYIKLCLFDYSNVLRWYQIWPCYFWKSAEYWVVPCALKVSCMCLNDHAVWFLLHVHIQVYERTFVSTGDVMLMWCFFS